MSFVKTVYVCSLLTSLSLFVSCKDRSITTLKIIKNDSNRLFLSKAVVENQKLTLNSELLEDQFTFDQNTVSASSATLSVEIIQNENLAEERKPEKVLIKTEISNGIKKRVTLEFLGAQPFLGKSNKKLKKEIDCSSVIDFEYKDGTALFDFSKFKNIRDCSFKDLSLLDMTKVGKRKFSQGRNCYSMIMELQLGRSAIDSFNQEGSFLEEGHPMTIYFQEMLLKIASVADQTYFKPKIYIADTKEFGAFSYLGGSLVIFRGLIESVNNEDALAAIIGHEWGHTVARHVSQKLTESDIRENNGTILLSITKNPKVLRNFLEKWSSYNYLSESREDEYEADLIGLQYATKAGYSPYGAILGLEKVEERGSLKGLQELWSTHPDGKKRIQQLKNYIGFLVGDIKSESDNDNFQSALLALQADPVRKHVPREIEDDLDDMSDVVRAYLDTHAGLYNCPWES